MPELRVRRRLTTKYTRTSHVLPRKKQRNVFPLMPGDDPELGRPLLPASEFPKCLLANYTTELYHAYWLLLHALTFMVPTFRRSGNTEALTNIAYFFYTLPSAGIVGCHECTSHYMDFANLSNIGRPKGNFFYNLVTDPDEYMLARWLNNLHNDVHRNRARGGSDHNVVARSEVPFERVKAYYEETIVGATTVVEAFLQSNFGLKLRADMISTEIVQGQEKPIHKHYTKAIGMRLKPIFPLGQYRLTWHKLRRIHDAPMLCPTATTAHGAVAILYTMLLTHMLVRKHELKKGDRADELAHASLAVVLATLALGKLVSTHEV